MSRSNLRRSLSGGARTREDRSRDGYDRCNKRRGSSRQRFNGSQRDDYFAPPVVEIELKPPSRRDSYSPRIRSSSQHGQLRSGSSSRSPVIAAFRCDSRGRTRRRDRRGAQSTRRKEDRHRSRSRPHCKSFDRRRSSLRSCDASQPRGHEQSTLQGTSSGSLDHSPVRYLSRHESRPRDRSRSRQMRKSISRCNSRDKGRLHWHGTDQDQVNAIRDEVYLKLAPSLRSPKRRIPDCPIRTTDDLPTRPSVEVSQISRIVDQMSSLTMKIQKDDSIPKGTSACSLNRHQDTSQDDDSMEQIVVHKNRWNEKKGHIYIAKDTLKGLKETVAQAKAVNDNVMDSSVTLCTLNTDFSGGITSSVSENGNLVSPEVERVDLEPSIRSEY